MQECRESARPAAASRRCAVLMHWKLHLLGACESLTVCKVPCTAQAEEIRSEAWAGAQRFRCALTTVGALLQQRGITDVSLLKVCDACVRKPTCHIQQIPARQADRCLQ